MVHQKRKLLNKAQKAYYRGRRLVAPLVGFPGCNLTGFSMKVAQQNHEVHYSCINELVKLIKPDIAFMLMDLSVEANALGLPVRFPTDQTSSVELHPVDKPEQLENYHRINILRDSRIESYIRTIEMMKIGLPEHVLVAGYVIGPLTLAGLLRSAQSVAMDSILNTEFLHQLCRFSTDIIQKYAAAQINAGADIICVLEPTAMMFGPQQFTEFSGNYIKNIMESYKYDNVDTIYHICGNTMHLLEEISSIGVAAISLDAPENGIDMVKAAKMVPQNVSVMGNVSPALLTYSNPQDVHKATKELLEKMKDYPNFIISTGCDVPQSAPIENIKAFMAAAKNLR